MRELAQMRYTEPVATLDADVLVRLPDPERLDVLSGIYEFCAQKGYSADGEAVRVGGWPTQFVPVFSDMTWPAKIRMAEQVRDSLVVLRRSSLDDRRDETAASPRHVLDRRAARR